MVVMINSCPNALTEALQTADVGAALHRYECAQALRVSISRKLCGGSTLVTVGDLALCEATVTETRNTLEQLVSRTPILVRHPVFAAALAHPGENCF